MNAVDIARKYNWNMPTVCPVCGATLEINESGELFCPNKECEQKVVHSIIKLSNKWNILELGPRIVEDFVNQAKIKSLAQFIKNIDSPILDEIAGKNAIKIRNNIKNALSAPRTTANFIAAFDIEGFGERKVQTLIDAGETLETLFKTSPNQISKINGWTVDSGAKFLQGLNEIKDYVLEVAALCNISDEKEKIYGSLSGLSFCFTGANDFKPEEKRKLLEEKVEAAGGTIDSVKKGLSYLVSSETGTAKMVKAEKNSVKVISYEEFYKLLGE